MNPRTLRIFSALVIASAVLASQPLVAADSTIETTGGVAPAYVGIWTGPGVQIVVVLVPLPSGEPEPVDDDRDKNSVILEDGAPF